MRHGCCSRALWRPPTAGRKCTAEVQVCESPLVNGFPGKGSERLLTQLPGFAIETHHGAVDALVHLIDVIGDGIEQQCVHDVSVAAVLR